MTVIRSSSRTASSSVNLLGNMHRLSDSSKKVQLSSITDAIVTEKKTGGDVILSTPEGGARASATIPLEEGDEVLVRLIHSDDDERKAHIISRYNKENALSKIEKFGINLINKYIKQNHTPKINALASTLLKAKVTYVTANRNTISYGSIKPGDEITIHILSPQTPHNGHNVLIGEVLGNSHNSVIINSSIGMMNISASSNLSMGDKIMFEIIGSADEFDKELIKSSISKLIKDISDHKTYFKDLLEMQSGISDDANYSRILQLSSSAGTHGITLARLFHATKNVAPNDVERWIDQDIIEPFESSSRMSILETVEAHFASLYKKFVDLKIVTPHNMWQYFEVPIPLTDQKAKMRARKEKDDVLEFILDLLHDKFGKIVVQGTVILGKGKSDPIALNMSIKHSGLPTELQTALLSLFESHKSLSPLEGQINFEAL